MPAYRILGQFRQFFLDDGRVNDGGSIKFFETDLTTLKTTYSDKGLTIPNPNPVPLDAAGRLLVDCWGDGSYGSEMMDADGVILDTLDFIQSGETAGQAIPSLSAGKFLTNDGSNLLWQTIIEVPDPTSMDGNVLYSDGVGAYWGPLPSIPEPPAPDVESTAALFRVGNFAWQFGTATIPATTNRTSSITATFPLPFQNIQYVNFTSSVTDMGSFQAGATQSVTGVVYGSPATSAILTLNSADDGGDGRNITVPVPVQWAAYGQIIT